MYAPRLVTAPTGYPVTLTEVEAHLRLTPGENEGPNYVLDALIAAATQHMDGWGGTLGRCLLTQVWEIQIDDWSRCVRLPFPDVSAATVSYTDVNDAAQTVDSALFDIRTDTGGSYVRFRDDFTYPALADDSLIAVQMTAGYGAASAVPMPIKYAILMHIATLYDHRWSVTDGSEMPLPHGYEALLTPVRRVWL